MKVQKAVKVIGLIGALCTGIAMIIGGDPVNGVGVISASLSSAGVLTGITQNASA